MERFSGCDAEVKITEQFFCQWECPVKALLQLPVGFSGILLGTQSHHVAFQFGIVKSKSHEEPYEEALDGAAAGEDSFVKAHPTQGPADFFPGKTQWAVGMVNTLNDRFPIGDYVPDRIGHRKKTIPAEKEAVKFVFNHEMVVAGFFRLRDHVAVALAV